jgi:hypothetical protein
MSYGSTKPLILAEKRIFFEDISQFSDWTKPLRGSLAFVLFVMREL